MPTSPPLGIATLAGFIGRELSEWEVIPLDLNLWVFRRLLGGMASGQIRLSPGMHQRIGADAATLLAAGKCFAEGGDVFYNQPENYDRFGGAFLLLIEEFGGALRAECEEWERSGTASPLLAEMAAEIDSRSPDVVGISVMFTSQAPLAAMLGRLQRQQKGRPVYLGGCCFNRESAESFLRWYPGAANAVVIGDGEEPLLALLKGERDHIPGVSIPVDGGIRHTPPVYQKNIDRYGFPDFSGLDIRSYFSPEPVAPLLLSRGCYWRKCAFCVHHLSAGNTYRPCSIGAATLAMGRHP